MSLSICLFKQKTAYEMRISDWSSDVCSSDLFPITVLVTKQTATGKRVVPVTYYPFLVTEQFDEWPEKDRRQRHWALIEDAPRVAYREDLLPLIKQFEDLRPWIIEAVGQYRSSQPEERSEEHTSELQSLMRTSYAVFCL